MTIILFICVFQHFSRNLLTKKVEDDAELEEEQLTWNEASAHVPQPEQPREEDRLGLLAISLIVIGISICRKSYPGHGTKSL